MSRPMSLQAPDGETHYGFGAHDEGGFTITMCALVVESGWLEIVDTPERYSCEVCQGAVESRKLLLIGATPVAMLVENLKLLRRTLCAYDPYPAMAEDFPEPFTCDCKYRLGANADKPFAVHTASEVTGCAELRETIRLLERML